MSNNVRGLKWQCAYIDQNINQEFIDNVIFPAFVSNKRMHGILDYNENIEDFIEWYE